MVDSADLSLQRALIIFSAQSGVITSLRYDMVRKGLELNESPHPIKISLSLKNHRGPKGSERKANLSIFYRNRCN
jgi:hypothetical protein